MIKLLAVDMDGTCLDSKNRMSDRTLAALKKAADAGVTVVPTTGRCLKCVPHRLAGRKDIYRYIITSNGAQILDCETGQTIDAAMIPKERAVSLLESCKKADARFGYAAHIRHEYLLQGRAMVLIGRLIYGKDAAGVRRVKDMQETVRLGGRDVEEIQLYFLSKEAKRSVKAVLEEYPDLLAAYTGTYVEIYAKEASKGNALSRLAKHIGIRKEEIACIGDGENDLSMFRESGLRFAMGNAEEILKEKADVILPSNQEDGAAEAIETYLI